MTRDKKVHVNFVAVNRVVGSKTHCWRVYSNAVSPMLLGDVKFRPAWRKYVFLPAFGTLYDSECLTSISEFCDQQTTLWRTDIRQKAVN